MNIVKELNDIKESISENTMNEFFYDFAIDNDSEIKFYYSIHKGFKEIKTKDCLFNACDRKTNIKGLTKEIKEICEYYKKVKEE